MKIQQGMLINIDLTRPATLPNLSAPYEVDVRANDSTGAGAGTRVDLAPDATTRASVCVLPNAVGYSVTADPIRQEFAPGAYLVRSIYHAGLARAFNL